MSGLSHLVKRFFGSFSRRPLSAEDQAWAAAHLLPAEVELWERMGPADRRHALGVARRSVAALDAEQATRPVVAAALLHDVGKVESGLGTYGRVMATLSAKVAGRDMAGAWSQTRGMTRRIGLYLQHEELGAELLALAGSDGRTVTLVRTWSDPQGPVAELLKQADDA